MLLELEKEENYLIQSEEDLGVLCPICQKHKLILSSESQKMFSCSCGQKFNFNGSLKELSFKIKISVIDHEKNGCLEVLSFFVEPKENLNILSLMCSNCDFYRSI